MTHNTRPVDFPTDAELAQAQPLTTLAALLDAFVGNDEWDEHDIRHECEAAAEFRRMGAEDYANGIHFVPEAYFVPGTMQYNAYCAGWYMAAIR